MDFNFNIILTILYNLTQFFYYLMSELKPETDATIQRRTLQYR